jgi:hypothetical protein
MGPCYIIHIFPGSLFSLLNYADSYFLAFLPSPVSWYAAKGRSLGIPNFSFTGDLQQVMITQETLRWIFKLSEELYIVHYL